MALAPLIALALLAVHVEGGASASATTQVGSPTLANDTAVEPGLFLSGALSLKISDPLEGVQIVYSPHFTLGGGEAAQLLNQISVAGNLRATASQTLKLSEALTVGGQDFSPLAPGNTSTGVFVQPPIDRLPPDEVLQVLTSATNFGDTILFSPSLHLDTTASFSIGGGLGSEARAQLPLQRTGSLGSSLGWALSRLDQLSFLLNGSVSVPESTERAESVAAGVGWAHVITVQTTTALQLGAAYLHNDGPQDLQQQPIVPTGSASITHRDLLSGRALSFTLSTAAAPAIDPLSGAAYLRGSLSGTASWSPTELFSFALATSGAHGLGSGLQHDWGAEASISASLRIPPDASASLGFRVAWLPPAEEVGELSGYQWSIFASVSWGDTHQF